MNPFESGAVIDMSVGHNSATPAPIGADALRVAAQAALTAMENLHEIDTETECITIDVRDEIDALRAALASTAQSAVVAPTVEQVEEAVGMGHGAWDCIAPDELIAAVLRLAAAPKATQMASDAIREAAPAAQGDAERLDWLLGEGRSMAIDSCDGEYRVVDAKWGLVVTDWMPTPRAAIDAARAVRSQTKNGA